MDAAPAAAPTRRKRGPAAEAGKKRPGGDARGRGPGLGASPAAPPADPTGSGAALAECTAACCVLCACLPVAVLCCVARAPLRVARRCCGRWRRPRRPRRRLAPGGSSSFSDAEVGEFLQGGGAAQRRAMGRDEDQAPARSRSPRSGRTT
ncbi:hypothetical protein BAE44_0005197 [Dichanthelium oligosanthes]|uniref:Uncharacterized protein n=1 Tax=Dichanthelium oligosanthes TaxID=888268 RepID=A0A1E5W8N6_9POAL|nr:hypothetical protein BAE44_0005197 [Dichanthelium oligosanthes]